MCRVIGCYLIWHMFLGIVEYDHVGHDCFLGCCWILLCSDVVGYGCILRHFWIRQCYLGAGGYGSVVGCCWIRRVLGCCWIRLVSCVLLNVHVLLGVFKCSQNLAYCWIWLFFFLECC
jgi:hypothetical protein